MSRVLYLATTQSYCTMQVNLTGIEQATNEQHNGRIANGPNHLTLVYRVDIVYLYTNVTCRTLAIEYCNLSILHAFKL